MNGVILVGCGNMGFAMLSGWIASGSLDPSHIAVVEPDKALRERAADLGVSVFSDAGEVPERLTPRLVILAVKPQIVSEVAPAYRRFADKGSAFLSVAAGTRLASLERLLGEAAPVVRCMPNTPASIGRGMFVFVTNSRVDGQTASFVEELLSSSGAVTRVADETLMDAVTAVSGSGPAYVFLFIECLTAAAVQAGLPRETADLLAMQTVCGAAVLAKESGETPETLRLQVTSPNGTTAAALEVLMGGDRMRNLMTEAVMAAKRRSGELG